MSSAARPGGKLQTQWRCNHCNKYLSSKRSYREHMNVHSERRPFQCDECEYAAASQMTLRRHRLRLHISKANWGYPCPYCSEIYMEPASYEQHVSRRHFGQSCTYGCPHQSCNFTSKSCRHFLDHFSRHRMVIISSEVNVPPFADNLSSDSIKASYYLIDDEIGSGYGKPPLEAEIRRYDDVLSLPSKSRPKSKAKSSESMSSASTRIISPISNQPRARRKIVKEEVPTDIPEITYVENDDMVGVQEITYEEEVQEENEEDEAAQYYELVDENGISIDNQYYEIDPGTEFLDDNEQFFDDSMDSEVLQGTSVAETTEIQVVKKEVILLPNGLVDNDDLD